jgi:hypothetical protein
MIKEKRKMERKRLKFSQTTGGKIKTIKVLRSKCKHIIGGKKNYFWKVGGNFISNQFYK